MELQLETAKGQCVIEAKVTSEKVFTQRRYVAVIDKATYNEILARMDGDDDVPFIIGLSEDLYGHCGALYYDKIVWWGA